MADYGELHYPGDVVGGAAGVVGATRPPRPPGRTVVVTRLASPAETIAEAEVLPYLLGGASGAVARFMLGQKRAGAVDPPG